jgi:hypothetical protein
MYRFADLNHQLVPNLLSFKGISVTIHPHIILRLR